MVLSFCLPTKTLAKQNVLIKRGNEKTSLPVHRNFGQKNTPAPVALVLLVEKHQRIFSSEDSAAFMTMDDVRVDRNILQHRICCVLTQAVEGREMENAWQTLEMADQQRHHETNKSQFSTECRHFHF